MLVCINDGFYGWSSDVSAEGIKTSRDEARTSRFSLSVTLNQRAASHDLHEGVDIGQKWSASRDHHLHSPAEGLLGLIEDDPVVNLVGEAATRLNIVHFGFESSISQHLGHSLSLIELALNSVVESAVQTWNTAEESWFDQIDIILEFLDISRVEAALMINHTRPERPGKS